MRAGRLETRRYRVRRGRRRALLMLALLGLGLFFAVRGGYVTLPDKGLLLSPAEEAAERGDIAFPAGQWYALSLGAFEDAAAAENTADSFRSRGAAGYVLPGTPLRVLAAAYESRSDAQTVREQLRANHGVDTSLTEIVWPEIRLRVSGPKGQFTAFQDACAALSQLPGQLSALSQALDRGETAGDSARQALLSQRDTLSALSERLRERFPGDAPETVRFLREAAEELSALLEDARGAESAVRLGGRVKKCHIAALCRCRDFAALLSP